MNLTGKVQVHKLNLTGKTSYANSKYSPPDYVTKIKKIIFDRYITPILSKNWEILKNNFFQINTIIKKIDTFYDMTQDDTLILYKYILTVIINTVDTVDELSLLEEKLFGIEGGKEIAKLTIKVPRIRLKPELELYNLIIGKPDKNVYDKKIVGHISHLLKKEYISFNEIEENVKSIVA